MVSPNGAQSLDRAISHGNLSSNLPHNYNDLLIRRFISNSIPEEIRLQNPSPSSSSSSFIGQISADRYDPIDAAAAPGDEWIPFQMAAAVQTPAPLQSAVDSVCYGGGVVKYERSNGSVVGYESEEKVLMLSGGAVVLRSDSPAEEKRRWSSDQSLKEKTIERKQKRMIKNRESAARSRARKQAHTLRLEEEVRRLRKLNEWLIKNKEMETQTLSNPTPQKYQLRRIHSSRF